MIHELKIAPCYFSAVESGEKTFEIRDNRDRGFQKGDLVVLKEYDRKVPIESFRFTGKQIIKVITYVINYEQQPGFVVFAMADPDQISKEHAV